MKKLDKYDIVFILALYVMVFGSAYFVGMKAGEDSGARQMARHILHPKCRSDGFDTIIKEETGVEGDDKFANSYFEGLKEGLKAGQDRFEWEYQTSDYEWNDSFDTEDLVSYLCERENIDPNKPHIFSCPKCSIGGARIEYGATCNTYFGFHTIYQAGKLASDEFTDHNKNISSTYCAKCLYPLGTDWRIEGMECDPNGIEVIPCEIKIESGYEDNFIIEKCTFIDPNDPNLTYMDEDPNVKSWPVGLINK